MTMIRYTWTEPNGTRHVDWEVELKDAGADPSFPIVILLHGLGGRNDPMIKQMADPAVCPGRNYNLRETVPSSMVDRGWYGYPNVGIWGFWVDTMIDVQGWEPYLNGLRYPTVNYGQIDPEGLLARPVTQLEGILRAVLAQTNKKVAFVCHSRGGLSVRFFLQRNRNDLAALQRIKGVVTLHSPHQGSSVADLATNIHATILQLLAWVCRRFSTTRSCISTSWSGTPGTSSYGRTRHCSPICARARRRRFPSRSRSTPSGASVLG
jgi:hypothetical protein